MFEILKERLRTAIRNLTRRGYVDEEALSTFIREVERGLLLSDVRVEDVLMISERIKKKMREEEPLPGLTRREHLIKVVYEELVRLLGGEKPEINIGKKRQTVIMLIGLQGSGKTTTVGKLAYFFKKRGYSVGVLCADTYRQGAQEQLKTLAKKAEVDFFTDNSKDISRIIKSGRKQFLGKEVIIIDTAGRHKEEKALLEEMKEISKIANPDITFLVVDATIGQQAYSQARAFHEIVPVGGIIVTKMDGTARGGGALSAAVATGAKVYFIGTGEKIEDIELYDPESFVSRLLGLGDIRSLVRKIEELEERERTLERAKKIVSGKFTLVDFIEQMEDVKKMGSFKKILDFLPIQPVKVPSTKLDEIDAKVRRWRYALDSMTIEERLNPEMVDAKRIKRVSKGSGLDEREIRDMLKQYRLIKKTLRAGRGKKLLRLLKKKGLRGFLK